MGFFDRFRKRVKEVADDTDIDSLTVDEESEEAQEAIAKRQQIKEEQEAQSEAPQVEATTSTDDDWEDIEEIEAISEPLEEEDEWDDWDDEPIPEQISPSLDKKQRKRLEKEAKEAIKERQRLKKQGYDIEQEVRPDGSKIDLQIMRSTTGRKLVEVKSSPRGSSGPTTVETETGKNIEIDLGGGVVESGGKIIKGGAALDAMLEELELVMLEADMGRASIEEVITALRNELVGNRLRKGADLSKVVEASLKRALRTLLSTGYWDFDATVDSLLESGDLPVVIMMVGVNGTG